MQNHCITMSNGTIQRPVISIRLERKILSEIDSICQEIEIERTRGLTNIIQYLIKPENKQATKAIMKQG